jgi:hypothetical protein
MVRVAPEICRGEWRPDGTLIAMRNDLGISRHGSVRRPWGDERPSPRLVFGVPLRTPASSGGTGSIDGVPRRRSLTSQLYRVARASNNARAASRGPGAYAKRVARRKVYRSTNRVTSGILRRLGL